MQMTARSEWSISDSFDAIKTFLSTKQGGGFSIFSFFISHT